MTKPVAALLTLVGILSASEANAQHLSRRGHSRGTVVSATPLYRGQVGASSAISSPWLNSSGVATRSSFAAQNSGGDDFPFYGVPYGHAYHAWSFTALSGAYGQNLARYYDPPVK
jgi:hypothetical protein